MAQLDRGLIMRDSCSIGERGTRASVLLTQLKDKHVLPLHPSKPQDTGSSTTLLVKRNSFNINLSRGL